MSGGEDKQTLMPVHNENAQQMSAIIKMEQCGERERMEMSDS